MYEINQRVRAVRKALKPKMSQTDFGEALGVGRNVIGNIEYNNVEQPTEQFLRLLCRTFSVSYVWLKEGTGEMFLDDSTFEMKLERLMSGENEFAKSIIRAMVKFDEEDWQKIKDLADKIRAGP